MLLRTMKGQDSLKIPGMAGEPCGKALRPPLEALVRYWRERADGRRMPERRDIDPVDIPSLLPHVFLVDCAGDPLLHRFRLMGGRVEEMFGRNVTGRCFAEVLRGPALEALGRAHDHVIGRVAPVLARGRFDPGNGSAGGRPVGAEFALLPLGSEETGVVKVLGGLVVTSLWPDPSLPLLETEPLHAGA